MPQKSSMIAAWLSEGKVQIYNISNHLKLLNKDLTSMKGKDDDKPVATGYHPSEGFALAWSPVKAGLMASGDTTGSILLWNPHQGGKWKINDPMTSHKGSVEDISWSPKEETVFASCSSDKTVQIWDTRKKKPALSYKAGNSDINVISWNHQVTNLLASGDDEGLLRYNC
jgi:ribosome assembly protein RRB1